MTSPLGRLTNDTKRSEKDKQPDKVEIWARAAIMSIDGISEHQLLGISKFLKDKKVESRIHAARALGALAALKLEIKSRVPDLIDALDDKDREVVLWSVVALGEIGPEADQAVKVLETKLAAEKDEAMRKAIQEAIDKIKTKIKKDEPAERKKGRQR